MSTTVTIEESITNITVDNNQVNLTVTPTNVEVTVSTGPITIGGSSNVFTTGTGVPVSAPDALGDMFFSTDQVRLWVAKGTSSVADWQEIILNY